MLKPFIDPFLTYCQTLSLAQNSIQALARYIKQLDKLLGEKANQFVSVRPGSCAISQPGSAQTALSLHYKHLVDFVISNNAGPTTIKMRIWAIKKFFAFLYLNGHIKFNIANQLNPPKIPKKETPFLTENELKTIINRLIENSNNPNGLRNMIIILLMATAGLRKSSLVALDREDIDLQNRRLWITEKGLPGKRVILIPLGLSWLINEYVYRSHIKKGALFLNHKMQRLSANGVNKIVNIIKEMLLKDGHHFAQRLHPHVFRHSAATQLNDIAGFTMTKEMLGHRSAHNTREYIHLSPASYGTYMKRHPYFTTKETDYEQ